MKYIDITFDSLELNLAAEEALLDWCEEGNCEDEILRFWESPETFVVVGYSGKISQEVNETVCRLLRVPILRRVSGGGTVVQGPGCLNYSLTLRQDRHASLKSIQETHCFILSKHRDALERLTGKSVSVSGTSDLTLEGKKFSGNAQRRKRNCLLFHGTFLLDFDLAQIQNLLPIPRRQPDYRQNRTHEQFLTNVEIERDVIRKTLKDAWKVSGDLKNIPLEKIEALAVERYASEAWNFKFR